MPLLNREVIDRAVRLCQTGVEDALYYRGVAEAYTRQSHRNHTSLLVKSSRYIVEHVVVFARMPGSRSFDTEEERAVR